MNRQQAVLTSTRWACTNRYGFGGDVSEDEDTLSRRGSHKSKSSLSGGGAADGPPGSRAPPKRTNSVYDGFSEAEEAQEAPFDGSGSDSRVKRRTKANRNGSDDASNGVGGGMKRNSSRRSSGRGSPTRPDSEVFGFASESESTEHASIHRKKNRSDRKGPPKSSANRHSVGSVDSELFAGLPVADADGVLLNIASQPRSVSPQHSPTQRALSSSPPSSKPTKRIAPKATKRRSTSASTSPLSPVSPGGARKKSAKWSFSTVVYSPPNVNRRLVDACVTCPTSISS